MNHTKIEWVRNPDGSPGYTFNPITGCLNHVNGLCQGGGFPCYAYRLAHGRLKPLYLNNLNVGEVPDREIEILAQNHDPFYPRLWEERLHDPVWLPSSYRRANPKGIFVCDMGELFGDWIPREWQKQIFKVIRGCPYHRFYLLTKQPQNLVKFSPFPENCWVGVTATNTEMFLNTCTALEYPVEAKVKYISLEPLLDWDYNFTEDYLVNCLKRADIRWLIIGACTGTYIDMANLCMKHTNSLCNYQGLKLEQWGNKWTAQPKIEWVSEIVKAADKAGVPLFLKDNLDPLLNPNDHAWAFAPNSSGGYSIRQEMPCQ